MAKAPILNKVDGRENHTTDPLPSIEDALCGTFDDVDFGQGSDWIQVTKRVTAAC